MLSSGRGTQWMIHKSCSLEKLKQSYCKTSKCYCYFQCLTVQLHLTLLCTQGYVKSESKAHPRFYSPNFFSCTALLGVFVCVGFGFVVFLGFFSSYWTAWETWIIILMFVGVFLKKQDQFVFRSKGISCGQLQICSLNISDCLAMETSMLLCFHDWLSYVPRA